MTSFDDSRGGPGKLQAGLILVLVGAALGLLFSGFSTYDFAQHLDRQVHGVHCSFLPGLTGTEAGVSGCQEVMMSPYSSVFRTSIWGGIPISLPAMSVFAFLLFFALELALSGRQNDRRATGFLALATALPAATSAVMAFISLNEVGAACKLCIGVYAASALAIGGGLFLWSASGGRSPAWRGPSSAYGYGARTQPPAYSTHGGGQPATSTAYLAGAFVLGVVFVAVPLVAWAAMAPDHSRFVGACGGLDDPSDAYATFVSMGGKSGGAPAIEVLDPLCPACRAFERRLDAAELDARMDRKAALFPLDNTCNWMVKSAIHPGACKVSEAVLCAGDRASEVIAWAFENQDDIRDAAAKDPNAAQRMVTTRFPQLTSCMTSAQVRSRLNKSLRWAVRNHLPVLTPQLYVAGVRLCDEDVDLGLDFALTRMLDGHRAGTLKYTPKPLPPVAPAPLAKRAATAAAPAGSKAHEPQANDVKETKEAGETKETAETKEAKATADTKETAEPKAKEATP